MTSDTSAGHRAYTPNTPSQVFFGLTLAAPASLGRGGGRRSTRRCRRPTPARARTVPTQPCSRSVHVSFTSASQQGTTAKSPATRPPPGSRVAGARPIHSTPRRPQRSRRLKSDPHEPRVVRIDQCSTPINDAATIHRERARGRESNPVPRCGPLPCADQHEAFGDAASPGFGGSHEHDAAAARPSTIAVSMRCLSTASHLARRICARSSRSGARAPRNQASAPSNMRRRNPATACRRSRARCTRDSRAGNC